MDEQPSTSKSTTKKSNKEPTAELPPELDISSDKFDPLSALYASADIQLTKRKSKIVYQNMSAFENDFKKYGLYGLSSNPKSKTKAAEPKPEVTTFVRNFLPHQMPVPTTGPKSKHTRTLLKLCENIEGPLGVLRDCMKENRQIKVYTRSEHGVRGTITGYLVLFDKHWNMLIRDVEETWKRRKWGYDDNKFVGTPEDCTERLRALRINIPKTTAKSLNRKNVELTRRIPQLLVRGQQVVLVISQENESRSAGY